MMGKTGEWTVSDKTALTPGPRLPERQHAGWQVSKKFEVEKKESQILQKEENSGKIDEESDKKKKRKKHKKEKKMKKERKEKSKKKHKKLSALLDDDEVDKKETRKRKQKKAAEKDANDPSQQRKSVEKSKSKKHKIKCREGDVSPSKKPKLVCYDDSSSGSESEKLNRGREAGKSANVDFRRTTTESRGEYIIIDRNICCCGCFFYFQ